MISSPPSKSNLYEAIYNKQAKKNVNEKMRPERGSVSFQKSTKTQSTKDNSVPKKSKLFLTKNFVKSITPFLKSMRNLHSEKAIEKPSNTDIFYYSLRKFVKSEIGVDELMYAKNFPNRYFLQKKEELRSISSSQAKNSIQNNGKFEEDFQKVSKSKTFNFLKQAQKTQTMKKFGILWKSIKERIDYRKKMKLELEKLNPYYLISTSDAKFFANFYSATNNLIDKIRNKDLINSSTNKKFYMNHDLKSLRLKDALLKRPKDQTLG